MKFSATIIGKCPSKSNQYEIIKKGATPSLKKSASLAAYEKSFYLQCRLRGLGMDKMFKFTMDVFYENMKPDLDNCLKVVLDCLQQCGVIKNDNQCVEIHIRKLIDKREPRIEFTLEPVDL